MKINLDCIPCFVKQTLSTARSLDLDEETTRDLLRHALGLLAELDWSLPPPVIGRDIHRAIRRITGDPDPYRQRKIDDTERALRRLPEIERVINEAEDPFRAAVLFSIVGNAIDLGAKTGIDADVNRVFAGALSRTVEPGALERLRHALSEAERVLFLCDNAGEIVFDRPLLEWIGAAKLTVAVRGGPTINDATLEDAERSGLTERYTVIDNGSDTPGTWLDDCSEPFVREFHAADLVLAKGQGNFECLNNHPRRIIFLFLAKCPLVARDVGLAVESCVIRDSREGAQP